MYKILFIKSSTNIAYKSYLKNMYKSNILIFDRACLRNRYNIDFAYLPAAILARIQCNATRLSAWHKIIRAGFLGRDKIQV